MDTVPRTNRAEEPHLSPSRESVEGLEEALATAHQRLQQRLANEIDQQRHEADRLRRECERARAEAEAVLAQANEAAQGITAEAKKAAELTMAEAEETAARRLSQANDTARAMLTRLRDQAGSLFASAAEEMEAVQVAIVAIQSIAHADQANAHQASEELPPNETVPNRADDERQPVDRAQQAAAAKENASAEELALEEKTASEPPESGRALAAEKEWPSRWLRSFRGRAPGATTLRAGAASGPAAEVESHPVRAARAPAVESVVTRLIVRPNVSADARTRIRDRFDAVVGIDGVKLGAVGDESFELLLIHQRDVRVVDSLLALAPEEEVLLTSQKPGRIELELTSLDWLEASTVAGSQPG